MAIISKDIKLEYAVYSAEVHAGTKELEYVEVPDLMEIGELGQAERDTIEITTLSDEYHVYTDGLKNYPDSITFKCLYSEKGYADIYGLTKLESNYVDEQTNEVVNCATYWRVSLPYLAGVFEFRGTPTIKLDGVGTNAALTMTMTVKPSTLIEFK